jgi:hypothetical protein
VPPELSRKNINFFDMMEEVSTRNIRMWEKLNNGMEYRIWLLSNIFIFP